MSGDRIDFDVIMRDQVSPASKRAGSSLDSLTKQMRRNQAAMAAMDRKSAMRSKNGDALTRHNLRQERRALSESIRMEKRAMAERARMQKQQGGKDITWDSVKSAAGSALVPGAVLGIAGAASMALISLGRHLGEVGAKVSSMSFALKQLTGDGQSFLEISKLAVKFGLDVDSTAHSYARLLKMQFSQEKAKLWLTLGADLQALGNTTEEVEGVMLAVSQIKAKDKLQQQELNQLAERGVSIELIREALAKKTGKTVQEVIKMQEAGEIDFGLAEAAIQAAILKKLHIKTAGEAAKAYTKTFDGMTKQAKSAAQSIENGLGKAFSAGFMSSGSGIGKILSEWNDPASKTGQLILKIGRNVMMLGEMFGNLIGPVWEVISAFGEGLMDGFDMETLAGSAGMLGRVLKEIVVPAAKSLGYGLGVIVKWSIAWGVAFVAGVSSIINAVTTVKDAVLGVPDAIVEIFSFAKDKLFQVGSDMIAGLGRGISAGWEKLKGLLPDKLKSLLGIVQTSQEIHSPSRLWARKVGAPMAQGIGVGFDGAISKGATPSIPLPRGGQVKMGGMGGVNVGGITINVTGAGDAKAVAESVMLEFETKLGMVFDRAFAGVGA